jgi:hypothetical protein
VAIKVIVELQAKPGLRDELKDVLESLIAAQGPGQDGFLGARGTGCSTTPMSWSRSPIGSRPRRGKPTCGKPRRRARTHRCSSCWPPRSESRSSASSRDRTRRRKEPHRERRAHCHLPPGRRPAARSRCCPRFPGDGRPGGVTRGHHADDRLRRGVGQVPGEKCGSRASAARCGGARSRRLSRYRTRRPLRTCRTWLLTAASPRQTGSVPVRLSHQQAGVAQRMARSKEDGICGRS